MKIAIINGPNLNLLGTREVDVYGGENFDTFFENLKHKFPSAEFSFFQSNIEGELIDELQKVGYSCEGIIFNPGGYTHTSVAIGDAIAAIITPVIEVHISNIFAREDYRHVSMIAGKCKGSISGFGLNSYRLAIDSFLINQQ